MGIDLLDLTFRVERVFKIKLSVGSIIEQTKTICPETNRRDLQVRHFVQMVKRAIEEQNSSHEDHLLNLLRPHIAECLGIKETDVVPDAWMIHDLGME
jgi:4-hydroxy-3-methylbut-2-enyl diphosphate reductase IspH